MDITKMLELVKAVDEASKQQALAESRLCKAIDMLAEYRQSAGVESGLAAQEGSGNGHVEEDEPPVAAAGKFVHKVAALPAGLTSKARIVEVLKGRGPTHLRQIADLAKVPEKQISVYLGQLKKSNRLKRTAPATYVLR